MSAVLQRILMPYLQAGQAVGYKSKSAVYQGSKDGLFVLPVHNGKHSLVPSDEVQALIDARVAGAGDDAIRALVTRLHAKRVEAA